jgi:hypothetical protein
MGGNCFQLSKVLGNLAVAEPQAPTKVKKFPHSPPKPKESPSILTYVKLVGLARVQSGRRRKPTTDLYEQKVPLFGGELILGL